MEKFQAAKQGNWPRRCLTRQTTVQYITLKLYVSLGLKVAKVHRVLHFHQEKWLEPYFQLNSLKRQEAKNKFEDRFYKLMNNSC